MTLRVQITEIYAFLPREAVTRFLMQCSECQRRGTTNVASPPSTTSLSQTAVTSPVVGVSPGSPTPPASPAAKPPLPPHHYHLHHPSTTTTTPPQLPPSMLALTAHSIDLSLPLTSTLIKRAQLSGVSHRQLLGLDRAVSLLFLQAVCT